MRVKSGKLCLRASDILPRPCPPEKMSSSNTEGVKRLPEIQSQPLPWPPAIDSSLPKNFYSSFILHGLATHLLRPGYLLCSLTLSPHLVSGYGFLHGGAIAALVDLVGSAAIDSAGPPRPGATVEVNVAFLATAFAGEEIEIEARVLKIGSVVGVASVELKKKETGTAIAQGRCTKNLSAPSKM